MAVQKALEKGYIDLEKWAFNLDKLLELYSAASVQEKDVKNKDMPNSEVKAAIYESVQALAMSHAEAAYATTMAAFAAEAATGIE